MKPRSNPDLSLARSARRLSRYALLLGCLIPPLVAVQYLLFNTASFPVPYGMAALLADLEWTGTQRALAAAVALLPASALAGALVAVGRVCREYGAGRLFSDTVLRAYRHLGVALVAMTVLHWLQPTLLGLALALTLPPGQRFVTVGVSSETLLLILLTALVFLLGSVMQVAQRVQSENAEIV